MNTHPSTQELYKTKNLHRLEENLDVFFNDKSLLIQAVTRKGFVKELKDKDPDCTRSDNERLEFLGDSVLELIIRMHLYDKVPDGVGILAPKCREIVKRRSLAKVAFEFGLDEHLYLSNSEEQELKRKPRILADSLEAVIGAVFLETGLDRTRKTVLNQIFHVEKSNSQFVPAKK